MIGERGDDVGRTFFIADTHFGDKAILRYENRPFADTAQMDAELVSRWNETVSGEDTVFVLGDFGAAGYEAEVLAQLNGRKILVKGNHDTASNEDYRRFGFAEVYDYPIIFENFWILSHDALYVNTNMPYANLFGHVHNSPVIKDYSSQHCCVSVERIGYRPISFDTVKKMVLDAVSCEQ